MNIIVVGAREEGKTTLSMSILMERHQGIVAFDPRGMIEGIVVWSPEELESAIENEEWKKGPIVYRFDSPDHEGEFDAFCGVVFPPNFTRGGFGVLIDEAGHLQTANSVDENLIRAIKQHPTQPPEEAITIIQTMHTLGETYARSRSLIDELYMFRLTAPSDIKAIQEFTGKPELVEIIRNLPQHHCVRYINKRVAAGQPEYIIMDDPAEWHVVAVNIDPAKKSVDNWGESELNHKRQEGWAEQDG